MSQRGSYCTEYFYCHKCLEAVRKVLKSSNGIESITQLPNDQGGSSNLLPPDQQHLYPILAGKVSGMYHSEELAVFDINIRKDIEKAICHKVRIAVMAEDGSEDENGAFVMYYYPAKKRK